MAKHRNKWYYEGISPDLIHASSIRQVLYSGHTRYQEVEVLELGSFGHALILDGKTQSTEADEFIYHESLVHPALVTHPRPEAVLIAGGGEGATAREVLRHSCVTSVEMVDLDAEVLELCRTHLPNHHQGAFSDPRLTLHIGDAKRFLEEHAKVFDLIVLDLPDPMDGGPAYQLYTQEFYRLVSSRLKPEGVVVTQSGPASPINYTEVFTAIHNTMETVFPVVTPYISHIQSFGETWGFTIASMGPDPTKLTSYSVDSCLEERGAAQALRFYDGVTHNALFGLPIYLRKAIAEETRLITAEHPLFVF
jgi:spermidine synthase